MNLKSLLTAVSRVYSGTYADDSSCIGQLSSVKQWFEGLLSDGPAYGYFPKPVLVV